MLCHSNWLLRSRSCAAATPALRSKPCVATQTGPKGFKRNPLESCVFLLLIDRGFAGLEWTCFRYRSDSREVPPLRRFPRCGITTRVKATRFSTSCSASLLNATYWHLHRAVSVCLGLLPLLFKERAGVRFARLSVILNHSSSLPSPLRGEGANPKNQ